MAEQHEDRGEEEQGDGRGEHGHERAAEAHRVEEALREHQQGGERRGHRQRAEQHGAAGGLERPADRRGRRASLGELLPVARNHEQRVVDRQPEPEPGREIEREDGHVRHLVRDLQGEERADDREAADHERQQGRDRAAEEQQRQQEQEGEREELGAAQVVLDLVVHLGLRVRRPADLHGAVVEAAGEALCGVLQLVVGEVLELAAHILRATVAGDQVGAAARVGGGHAAYGGIGSERARDPRQLGAGGLRLRAVRGLHEGDQAGARVEPGGALEQRVGAGAVGGRVVGAVWPERLGDVAAQHGGHDSHDGADRDHSAGMA